MAKGMARAKSEFHVSHNWGCRNAIALSARSREPDYSSFKSVVSTFSGRGSSREGIYGPVIISL